MAKRDFMEELLKLDGAMIDDSNPFATVIRSPSPSFNFIFGNTHGLPRGFSLVLYGPPKCGKSVIAAAMAGQTHRDYPNAFVIKFNAELRERAQFPKSEYAKWGIDPRRYVAYEVNSPELIFDRIEQDFVKLHEQGMDIALVIIDSLNAIKGRRSMGDSSVMSQQIGDEALTIKTGLKRILEAQRRLRFGLIMTTHITAEMDRTEQMRGNKFKMSSGYGAQHHAEYFVYLERNATLAGRTDLAGNAFEDKAVKDMAERPESTGHKIRAVMKDSTLSPKGRVGEFTWDYRRGIINTHEEVAVLGVRRGVIEKPNNVMYGFGGKQWRGLGALVEAIKDDHALYDGIVNELRRRDVEHTLPERPVAAVEEIVGASGSGGENEPGEDIARPE